MLLQNVPLYQGHCDSLHTNHFVWSFWLAGNVPLVSVGCGSLDSLAAASHVHTLQLNSTHFWYIGTVLSASTTTSEHDDRNYVQQTRKLLLKILSRWGSLDRKWTCSNYGTVTQTHRSHQGYVYRAGGANRVSATRRMDFGVLRASGSDEKKLIG
jgi:hypothetical protein